ncbi:hypothetical protein DV737_g4300, partial [Chaetothyriales sp. CBS 132003]
MSLSIPSSNSNHDDAGAGTGAGAIDVTIRFSASLPDLPLSISLATQPHANTCTLKQLIRRSLPAECANRRIRLICAGKALLDNDLLTASLKQRGGGAAAAAAWSPLPLPVSRPSTPASNSTTSRASTPAAAATAGDKGKTPIRDPVAPASQQQQLPRLFIHCSIGDLTLPPDELEREARDAWLDGSDSLAGASAAASMAGGGATSTADGSAAAAGTGYEATEQSALDDMLFGTAMGFFWPVGCLLWGMREEGVWSTRRKMAVVVGVCLNLVIGLVKFGA